MSKIKPGIIVGAALGILLALTVLINVVTRFSLVGCCNCLWPIAGGLLATLWYIKGSPVPANVGDGAVVGLIAGLVGGLIYFVLALPIQYFLGAAAMAEAAHQLRQISPDFRPSILLLMIIGGIIGFFICLVLSIIGGLIAVPLFEKRKGDSAPPPPQGFGGTPGGGYGSVA